MEIETAILHRVCARYGLCYAAMTGELRWSGHEDPYSVIGAVPSGEIRALSVVPMGQFGNCVYQLIHAIMVARQIDCKEIQLLEFGEDWPLPPAAPINGIRFIDPDRPPSAAAAAPPGAQGLLLSLIVPGTVSAGAAPRLRARVDQRVSSSRSFIRCSPRLIAPDLTWWCCISAPAISSIRFRMPTTCSRRPVSISRPSIMCWPIVGAILGQADLGGPPQSRDRRWSRVSADRAQHSVGIPEQKLAGGFRRPCWAPPTWSSSFSTFCRSRRHAVG